MIRDINVDRIKRSFQKQMELIVDRREKDNNLKAVEFSRKEERT